MIFFSSLLLLSGENLNSTADLDDRFQFLKFAPLLSDDPEFELLISQVPNQNIKNQFEQRRQYALNNLKSRHHLTPTALLQSYDRIETHPLILEAVDILTKSLSRYARGIYVTSMNRTWNDQYRLSHHRRSRRWTTSRSKHLVGMAADIAFVGRRRNMYKIHAAAERILKRTLGAKKTSMIRVVRERHCIHVEIDSKNGWELIKNRSRILENLGIIPQAKYRKWSPVPEMAEYLPLQIWQKTEKDIESLAL